MRLLALALSAVTARAACRNVTIDFLLLETNSMTAAIKDDIRSDLAVIGIDIVSRVVDYETFIADILGPNTHLNLATDKKVESVIPILTFSISTNFFSLKQPNNRS